MIVAAFKVRISTKGTFRPLKQLFVDDFTGNIPSGLHSERIHLNSLEFRWLCGGNAYRAPESWACAQVDTMKIVVKFIVKATRVLF